MENILENTVPKPFIFVLMPFDPTFDDIYKFGIKGAAQEIDAYAERVDEQIFADGMLDRIFNQISKADVIVADMSGRNPNVFYEVGYAHALGKIVLLLTQNANDIPFDLEHRQHTIYGGSIERLRKELVERLKWAIAESKIRRDLQNQDAYDGYLEVIFRNTPLRPAPVGVRGPRITRFEYEEPEYVIFPIELRNPMLHESPPVQSAHLFLRLDEFLFPAGNPDIFSDDEMSDGLIVRFALDWHVPALPARASHTEMIIFTQEKEIGYKGLIPMRIRLSFLDRYHDYPFVLDYEQTAPRRSKSNTKSEGEVK